MLMRQFTIKSLLATALAIASQGVFGQVFTQTDIHFIGTHRSTPVIGDYNSDGLPDIYYGGVNWLIDSIIPNWVTAGILYTNKGNGEFACERGLLTDSAGFAAHGLPPTDWGRAYFVDVNNDGNLDFFVQGQSDAGCGFVVGDEPDHHYSLLYTNGGAEAGHQFSIVPNSGIINACDAHASDNYAHSYYDFGDYDNDGYQDLIMLGERNYMVGEDKKWERYVKLFHNNGDNTFSEKKVFSPIAYDSNPRPDNLFEIDTLTFEYRPLMIAKPMSNGAVKFADLNNDGLLDIICTGWVDGTNGGGALYIYKNNGDGTFQEVDLSGQNIIGCYEAELQVSDLNNDGYLDFLLTGTPNSGDKRADIYLNNGTDNGEFKFTQSTSEGGNGLKTVSASVNDIVDLNADGLADMIITGWNSTDSWSSYVFFQNSDNTFTQQESGLPWFSCSHAIGDMYQRNTMDVFGMNTSWNGQDWSVDCNLYKSNNDNENTPPSAPTNLSTSQDGDLLTITWDPATDEQTPTEGLYYNVYVKDLTTGKVSMLYPADLVTGRLLAFRDMQHMVHTPESPSYFIHVDQSHQYEIGVQAVDNGYAASPFTTADVTLNIQSVSGPSDKVKVHVTTDGVRVDSAKEQTVNIYTPAGHLLAKGTTGKVIPVNVNGVLLVKAGTYTTKVIK